MALTTSTEATGRGAAGSGSGTGTAPTAAGDRVRALPGGVAAAAVAALLWVVNGPVGLVGGGVLLVAWAVLPSTYAFAVGQVALVAVTRPDGLFDAGLLPLALAELGLVGVLVGPSLRSTRGRRTAAWTLLGTIALGGIAVGSFALWERAWIAASVLVGTGALCAYGLHRYELVVLGKVPDPDGERGDRTGDGIDPDDGQDVAAAETDPDTGDRSPEDDGSVPDDDRDPTAEGGEAV